MESPNEVTEADRLWLASLETANSWRRLARRSAALRERTQLGNEAVASWLPTDPAECRARCLWSSAAELESACRETFSDLRSRTRVSVHVRFRLTMLDLTGRWDQRARRARDGGLRLLATDCDEAIADTFLVLATQARSLADRLTGQS